MLVYLFSGVEMTCRSTRIDPATRPKILGPEMQGGPGMRIETTSHAERRRCQVAVWIQEENGSFRISVYCLSCLCWYLMVKNHIVLVFHHHYMNPPKSHVFLCFTQWIRPFDPFWLLVSTGFWNAWATPLGFLGRLVVLIKPHVMDVSCVVAAMKTWRRCDGGKGPRGEDETNGMWAEINQFTNDFASNSNPTPLPLLFIFRKVYGNPITLISNTPSNKGTQEEYLQY